MDALALLQGRINYLEGENAYLKDLLERWLRTFSLIMEKGGKDEEETKRVVCRNPA